MWKKILLSLGAFFMSTQTVNAIYNPLNVPNNRFGMHIVDENDMTDTAKLVNSSGGDWGYVKIVIREDDRDLNKWQNLFNQMRRLHLIPIIRLATKVEKGSWVKPRISDIGSWVDFLNGLNWVTANRYVIIFNEPNHAKEWGNDVNPEEYAWFLKEFSRRLKSGSSDFYILPAGLDATASNTSQTMDETEYIKRMIKKEPDVFEYIDGWTSHSYPNPGFSGRPFAYGRGTVSTFNWELNFLNNLGVRSLPVFIAETGWQHSEGKNNLSFLLTPETVADYFQTAYQTAWTDARIVAITPFLLNYQDQPFDHFSWKKYQSQDFYPVYKSVQNMTKIKANPERHISVRIINSNIPTKLVTDSKYNFTLDIENSGQTIISIQDKWQLTVSGLPGNFKFDAEELKPLEPNQTIQVNIKVTTPKKAGKFTYNLNLTKDGKVLAQTSSDLFIIPPPSLLIVATTWLKQLASGDNYQLYIYDNHENLLHQDKNLHFDSGIAHADNLSNIVPNSNYRLVLSKPYYLPRQIITQIYETKTTVTFPTLLPLDPSNDGALTLADVTAFFTRPLATLRLLVAL